MSDLYETDVFAWSERQGALLRRRAAGELVNEAELDWLHLAEEIETVGAHLTEHFAIARVRVHDLWHWQHRLIRKILAHTVGVFLNLQAGRPPLDLDGLLAA